MQSNDILDALRARKQAIAEKKMNPFAHMTLAVIPSVNSEDTKFDLEDFATMLTRLRRFMVSMNSEYDQFLRNPGSRFFSHTDSFYIRYYTLPLDNDSMRILFNIVLVFGDDDYLLVQRSGHFVDDPVIRTIQRVMDSDEAVQPYEGAYFLSELQEFVDDYLNVDIDVELVV